MLKIIFIVIATLVFLAIWLTKSRYRYTVTREEMIRIIRKRLEDGISKEWDYFRLVTIPDGYLDHLRARCLQLDYAPPDERIRELGKIIKELEDGRKTA